MEEVVKYIEEIRFIWELLAAVNIFATIFTKKRDRFRQKLVVSVVILTFLSCMYPKLVLDNFTFTEMNFTAVFVHAGWYVLLTLMAAMSLYTCYDLTKADTLFLCAAGYAMQHLEFVVVNEVLAKGIWPTLETHVPLYVFVCVGSSAIFYIAVYRYISKNFRALDDYLLEDKPKNIMLALIMFAAIVACAFMCQTIFTMGQLNYDSINYLGAAVDAFMCMLVLGVGYAMCQISGLNREKGIIEQLLYERKRQYELSKENIEVINRKCHDLKHQIRALENVDASERKNYIDELDRAIDIYDSVLNTGNEVVDTILSEKSLNCEKRNIRLSCICDASYLDFMSTLDIYALLGNALDNAIETVSKFKDENKRVISMTIKSVGDFLSIQTENYYERPLEFSGDLPRSIKKNKAYHGYGMKSMAHIAKKYGGSLVCDVDDNTFKLQILLPMPPEFLRLYELREKEKNTL
ncbi:MAG: ATP-binding protein [Lachnospiraceae bacterium]|nr:ATP-binding protein [Lachnospiraceae bacterium]